MKNLIKLFYALTAAIILVTFSSCGHDDPLPPDPPKPPVSTIDSIRFNITSADYLEKNAAEITKKIGDNDPAKHKIIITVPNSFGINAAQKKLMPNFAEWLKLAGLKNVEITTAGKSVWPTEKIILDASDIDWIKVITIGANPSNGMRFFVSLTDMEVYKAAGLDNLVDLDVQNNGEYGDATVITCSRQSDLVAKADSAITVLNNGKKVALVINGVYYLVSQETNALNPLLGRANAQIDSKNAIVSAGSDSVYVAQPGEFAKAFENISRSTAGGGKYFSDYPFRAH